MSMLVPWLEFVFCAALIAAAGPVLTQYGDIIARLTGLSRSWIGLILLATATSLPKIQQFLTKCGQTQPLVRTAGAWSGTLGDGFKEMLRAT